MAAGARRLVYASRVAAYGFHGDRPPMLTEDIEPRGTERHYYSAQKAELEGTLATVLAGSDTEAYVFRPCIVAGPDARAMFEAIPYIAALGPDAGRGAPRARADAGTQARAARPGRPVPARSPRRRRDRDALRPILGRGAPGVYNLAVPGR